MAVTNTGIVERVITGVNDGGDLFIDNSTSTTTNTGIVERPITGVNESDLWLDSESTSIVSNTGIVERPITGVNESDPMFPDNTISNIINLADNLLAALFEAFKTRVLADGGTVDNEVGLDIESFDDTTYLTLLPNAYKDGVLYSVLPESGVGDFSVVRGSGATRVNKDGLIESVGNNIPRIDHATGEGVILREAQSTNLVTQSELFSDASWDANSDVIIDKGYLAPDGTNNASKVTVDGTNPKVAIFLTGTKPLTKSVYARTVSGTGTIYLGEGSLSGSLVNVTDQWQRFEITNYNNNFYGADFRGSSTLTEVIIWGAQLESQSYATSYIPTSGAIATRLADVISLDLTSFTLTNITETIDGVEQTPITSIPSTYTIPQGRINKITMI